jgi:hypothetical protein
MRFDRRDLMVRTFAFNFHFTNVLVVLSDDGGLQGSEMSVGAVLALHWQSLQHSKSIPSFS